MKDEQRKRSINIIIGDIRLPLTVPAEEEAYFREAGVAVNQLLQGYRGRYTSRAIPPIQHMSMAALDRAYHLEKLHRQIEEDPWTEQVSRLNSQIESVLSGDE